MEINEASIHLKEEESLYIHFDKIDDTAHIKINTESNGYYGPRIIFYLNDQQLTNFKNSVIAEYERYRMGE